MTGDKSVPVIGVCEIALEQNDLAAAQKFYADVLGFPVVERWHRNGETVWVMAGDRTRIGLWKPQLGLGGGRGGVHVHFAMGLPAEAYDSVVERLRKHGYEVLDHDHGKSETAAGAPPTSPTRAAMSSSSGPGTWRSTCASWRQGSRRRPINRTGSGSAWVVRRGAWRNCWVDREILLVKC